MRRFFWGEDTPEPLACVRIGLGLVLFAETMTRWPCVVELYSSAGRLMPVFPGSWEPFAPAPGVAVVVQSLRVVLALTVLLGWNTRVGLVLSALLGAWFGLLDLPGTFKKYSAIELHLQLLLACGQPAAVLALDARIARQRGRIASAGPIWPRRLIQILFCSIYLSAALTKLRLPDFSTGTMLEFALLDDLWGGLLLGRWMADHPDLLVFASVLTLLFEILFPVLIWFPATRRIALIGALLFHGILAVTMQLGAFSWVMISGLMAFLESEDLHRLKQGWGRWTRWRVADSTIANSQKTSGFHTAAGVIPAVPLTTSWRAAIVSWGIWAFVVTGASVGGGLAQWATDRYGVFGRSEIAPATPLVRDEVDQILVSPAYSASDFVHRLQLGTRLGHSRAFGDVNAVRRGMTVHALARLVRRTARLRLAWLLIAPDGREVARRATLLEPSVDYATVGFEMTEEAPAGRYRVILQLDDVDAADAEFQLRDDGIPAMR